MLRQVILLLVFTVPALAWEVPPDTMKTPWTEKVSPEQVWPENPRPQMQRETWLNLNGLWQYQQAEPNEAPPLGRELAEEILVPFPVEAPLSGIKRWDDRMWYRRLFRVPEEWEGQRVQLFFGAVDWESKVYVNGTFLGMHRGGYDSFHFDITDYLQPGGNELIVGVYDSTSRNQAKGKQTRTLGRYSYTACSGIWQTVWLEPTTQDYITSLRLVPKIADSCLQLEVKTSGSEYLSVEAVAYDGDTPVGRVFGNHTQILDVPVPHAKLWSPDNPFLYDLKVTLYRKAKVVDRVSSYFGMREIKLGRLNGVVRPLLNGKFVYQTGTLDQGWWPDGLYMAPTDGALKFDIQIHKDMGFNMIRKHVKIEPLRWYYWCDKLGILVWQDMPHRGAFDPDDRSTVTDAEYVEIMKNNPNAPLKGNAQFEHELRQMVRQYYNSPSIIQWVIFNEGWGVYDRDRITEMVRDLDDTRLIGTLTGGEDKGGFIDTGAGDVRDHHTYGADPAWQVPNPDLTANPFRISALGEYGGIEAHVMDHLWGGTNREGLPLDQVMDRYISLQEKLRPHIRTRLSATACTQITDVETELNGLWTYDRKVAKVDVAQTRAVNLSMIAEGDKENHYTTLPLGDLGTGYYRNPVLVGAKGNVSVVRVEKGYYATDADSDQVWFAEDLVNWELIKEDIRLPDPVPVKRDDYYYRMVVIKKPVTMVRVQRAVSLEGPWELTPLEPYRFTSLEAKDLKLCGPGTLVDDVKGKWWLLVTVRGHAEHSTCRTLLLPVVWTEVGWPTMRPGFSLEDVVMKPLFEWGKRNR